MDTIEYWKRQWNSISDTRNVANNSDAIEQEQRRGIYYYDTKGKLVRHENSEEYRGITLRLYGGDQEMRIQQEIVLGMAGVNLLKTLGLDVTVYHMNEGHSSFLILQVIQNIQVMNKH